MRSFIVFRHENWRYITDWYELTLNQRLVVMDGAGGATLSLDVCPPSCSTWRLVRAASLDTCRPADWTQIALTRYHTVTSWLIGVKSTLKPHIRNFIYICVTRCHLVPILDWSKIPLKPVEIRFLCALGMCKPCFHYTHVSKHRIWSKPKTEQNTPN